MAASNEARIIGVMAASGSGKGLWIKALLKREKPARLVIWDYKNEYVEAAKTLVHSLESVRKAMIRASAGPLQIRYKCKPGTTTKQTQAEFEGLCRLVQAWGDCCFLAEELSNVTTPSWAPAAWREMSTGGRHEKVFIIGVAQNPALIDKTFLSNCTMIHVGPLREHRHRQAVARSMDVPVERLTALEKFQYIQRDNDTKELNEGWIFPPGYVAGEAKTIKTEPDSPLGLGPPSASATGAARAGRKGRAAGSIAPIEPLPTLKEKRK
jgi:hypothetical protein